MDSIKEHQDVLFELLLEFDRVCTKFDIPYVLFAGSALGAVRHKGFIPWDDDLDVALLRTDYEKLMSVSDTDWGSDYYLQREFSEHWPLYFSKLRKNNTTCLEKYHPKDSQIHQGIYIDIFPIDNASDNPFMRRIQFGASKVVLAKAFYKRGYETNSILKKAFMAVCRLLPMKPFHKLTVLSSEESSKFVHSFFGGTSSYKKGLYKRTFFTQRINMDFESASFPISAQYDDLLTIMYGDYMTIPDERQRQIKRHALLVDTKRDYSIYNGYRDNMEFEILTRSIR